MKKFMFLSLVLAVFAISCGGDEPGIQDARPDVTVPEIGGTDAEITTALSGFYKKSDSELAAQWADSKLVVDLADFHNKVLLGAVGNNENSTPSEQGTFIALFIGKDNNIGYASSELGAQAAINEAIAKEGKRFKNWDPRKVIYKDAGSDGEERVKISWLGRLAKSPKAVGGVNQAGAFEAVTDYNGGNLGANPQIGDISLSAKFFTIGYTEKSAEASGVPARGGSFNFAGNATEVFTYEGINAGAESLGNPLGGKSPQRRAWAWISLGSLSYESEYDAIYSFRVALNKHILFGYAPSDKGQSGTAFPTAGASATPNYSLVLADGDGVTTATSVLNNSSPLGKQVIFRGDTTMLITVVADSIHKHNNMATVGTGDTKKDQAVVLLEFPASSGLDAIFDGYANSVDFPGYKNVFGTANEANPPTISTDFGADNVNGPSLKNADYATMKVPFLLLDTVPVE